MSVSALHVDLCVCTLVCAVCLCLWPCVRVSMWGIVCLSSVLWNKCECVREWVCVYWCISVYQCVCVCVCVYIHLHTFT